MSMIIRDEAELIKLGERFGGQLKGGEVIELLGDVGAGKTTFTKGVAKSLGISEEINSPSFTIMKEYEGNTDDKQIFLKHYDFYRLNDAGVMKDEIIESAKDKSNIVIIEWAKDVAGVLSEDRLQIEIKYLPEGDGRELQGLFLQEKGAK
jgi:ATPase, YjeE family